MSASAAARPAAQPAEVFRDNGLDAPGWLRSHSQSAIFSTADSARRLVDSLIRLGGLYAAFGHFLRWRADLLEPEYRDALRAADFRPEPISIRQGIAILRGDLGANAEGLAQSLQPVPLWSTLSRTAWRGQWKGTAVVVQVAREPVADAELNTFEKGIRHLGHSDLARASTPAARRQFREWIRAGENCARERAYLEVLNRNQDATLAGYPELIPEASGARVLVWKYVEGQLLSDLLGKGDKEAMIAAAAAVLEQFCSLAVVEADLDPSALLLDSGGRLIFRRISRPVAVPPAMVNGGMKYISAVLTGSDTLAAEQLSFLAAGAYRNETARDLVEAFSSIEPELKIRLWFPSTAGALENNWRALEHLGIPRLLYLDCLQRNLSALGYWNADAVAAGAPRFDAIAEAQWAVIGRLMRAEVGEFAKPRTAAEWMVGAGILMFGAAREFNRLAEEIRENNLTLGVEIEPAPGDPRQQARNWTSAVAISVLLAGLLAAIRWGPQLGGGWRTTTATFAAAAVASLFWLISRLG